MRREQLAECAQNLPQHAACARVVNSFRASIRPGFDRSNPLATHCYTHSIRRHFPARSSPRRLLAHPGLRRVPAGLLLRRQLGDGRRRLSVAAQVRSGEREFEVPLRRSLRAPHATECSVSSSQSSQCINFCRKFVPNGCDCFGCCLCRARRRRFGWHRRARRPTSATRPSARPARRSPSARPCERCEICIGKPTIPADCATYDGGTDSGTPPPACDSDFPPCGPGTNTPVDGCPTGQGCITGCCFPINP